jgi:hypothetical protein
MIDLSSNSSSSARSLPSLTWLWACLKTPTKTKPQEKTHPLAMLLLFLLRSSLQQQWHLFQVWNQRKKERSASERAAVLGDGLERCVGFSLKASQPALSSCDAGSRVKLLWSLKVSDNVEDASADGVLCVLFVCWSLWKEEARGKQSLEESLLALVTVVANIVRLLYTWEILESHNNVVVDLELLLFLLLPHC